MAKLLDTLPEMNFYTFGPETECKDYFYLSKEQAAKIKDRLEAMTKENDSKVETVKKQNPR